MQTHVKVLGVLYLVVSGFFLLVALFLDARAREARRGSSALRRIRTTQRSRFPSSASPAPRWRCSLASSRCLASHRYGLLKYRPWARVVGIVLSAINLINVPFGTVLGVLRAVGTAEQGR